MLVDMAVMAERACVLEAVDMAVMADCSCVLEESGILAAPAVTVGDDGASDQVIDSLTEEPLEGIDPVTGVVGTTGKISLGFL